MSGKPRREGWLSVDHRDSPGVDPALAAEVARRAGRSAAPAVGAGKRFEAGTVTCLHCNRVVILNPLRTRARHYCPRCDGYICDDCGATAAILGTCRPFDAVLDFVQAANARAEDAGEPVVGLPDLAPLYSTVSVPVAFAAGTVTMPTDPPPAADPYRDPLSGRAAGANGG